MTHPTNSLTMTTYQIAANGTDMGAWDGETREDAIAAYCRSAGYASIADAASALGHKANTALDAHLARTRRAHPAPHSDRAITCSWSAPRLTASFRHIAGQRSTENDRAARADTPRGAHGDSQ